MIILFLIITYIILRQTPAKAFADRRVLKILRKFEQMMSLRLARRDSKKKTTLVSRYYIFWIAAIEHAVRITHPKLTPPSNNSDKGIKKKTALETYAKL